MTAPVALVSGGPGRFPAGGWRVTPPSRTCPDDRPDTEDAHCQTADPEADSALPKAVRHEGPLHTARVKTIRKVRT